MSVKTTITSLITALITTVKEYLGLFLTIAVLAALALFMWRFGNNHWEDFGLNAFTEVLGIAVTVFIIDKLLKLQEKRRLKPLQAAAFRDVQQFINGLASTWLTAYKWSGKERLPPPTDPHSTRDFLNIVYFNKIRSRLNLDAEAAVFPKRTWRMYLPEIEKKYRTMAERILERHVSTLDPLAYGHVHKILHGFLNETSGLITLEAGHQLGGGFTDRETWEQLPDEKKALLGHYWIVLEEEVDELRKLYIWCESNSPT